MAKGCATNPSARGSSPSGAVAGAPGHSPRQHPFPGPTGAGTPASLKKALSKKPPRGKATGYAGTVR